ncbi:MAG: radical SAM protein [Eubacteriales bacterium]|nr:radical SAM protein [Eubacteriales bacterium]
MKPSRREYKYALENFHGVLHTTLNPEGPGVVRIFLIPPKFTREDIPASVAIINGQDIIPVNLSWSILLSELIKEVNLYHEKEITDQDAEMILKNTCKKVKRVYPFVSSKQMKNDVFRIMNTFTQIAYNQPVEEEIGYMSIGDYAPYMRAPHRMDLMVSAMTKEGKWHCNQKCIHCYAAGQVHAEEKELSTEEWKQVLVSLREAGIPQVTFTGGEPTMREDLVELVDAAQWFMTRMNTNGILLTEELCKQLMEASLDSVQITFYSADETIHNQLVGAEQYHRTVVGIENALKAGLSVSINTPLCTLNKDYVKTLEFLHEKGVLYVTCSGLITTGNAEKEESEKLQLSTDELKEILRDAVEYAYSHGMEISFTSPGWVEAAFCEELGIMSPTCGACLSNMAITPSGNVVPCQSWLSGETLGNVLDDSWESIWNHPECVNHRNYSARMTGLCPLRRERHDI